MQIQFILGSQSPRRKELVSHLGIPFKIVLPHDDENLVDSSPEVLAEKLACQKASEVASKVILAQGKPLPKTGFLILAADTVVSLGERLFGKPKDVNEAKEMLLALSEKTHMVSTGVCLELHTNNEIERRVWSAKTKVTFHPIAADILNPYLKTGESLDKAGAYGIQGHGLVFIDKIEGSYSNVVGLPIDQVTQYVKELCAPYLKSIEDWRTLFV